MILDVAYLQTRDWSTVLCFFLFFRWTYIFSSERELDQTDVSF